ncbi:hypothetical protein SAMN05445850_8212, partial [Paraburkholderia tuberum]
NDPEINIAWGMKSEPIVTGPSANGAGLPAVEVY